MLGGRVAEELVFHDPTTGASNDIEKATAVARAMVMQYGMSARIGAIRLGQEQGEVFLGRDMGHIRDYSEGIAEVIDEEVRAAHREGARRGLADPGGQPRRPRHPRPGAARAGDARQGRGRGDLQPRAQAAGARGVAVVLGAGPVSDLPPVTSPGERLAPERLERATGRRGARRPSRRARRRGPSARSTRAAWTERGRPDHDRRSTPPRTARRSTTRAPRRAVRELLHRDRRGPRPRRPAGHPGPGGPQRTREIFAGLRQDPEDVLTTTFDLGHDEMVLVKDIEVYSTCEHHLVPFHGVAHVGLHPERRTAGSPGCPSWPGWSTSTPSGRRCRSG